MPGFNGKRYVVKYTPAINQYRNYPSFNDSLYEKTAKEKARPKTRPIYCCQPSRWVVLPAPSMRMNFFLWTPCLSDDSFQAIFSSLLTTILVSAQFPWASLWPPSTHLPCLPIHERCRPWVGFSLNPKAGIPKPVLYFVLNAFLSRPSCLKCPFLARQFPYYRKKSPVYPSWILLSMRAISLALTSLEWFQDVLSWLSSMTEIHLSAFLAAHPWIGLSKMRHPGTCPSLEALSKHPALTTT